MTRRGLTLLELILALLLMTTILAATWSLLGIFRDRLETSQRQTEQWQLVRSLQQTLAADLRGCGVRPQAKETGSPVATRSVTGNLPAATPALDDSPNGASPADYDSSSSLAPSTRLPTDGAPLPGGLAADADAAPMRTGQGTDEIVLGTWLHPDSFLLGTSQGLVIDTVPPYGPLGPQPPTEAPSLEEALIPDTVRRIVYVFHDPLTAARLDRPPGLIRCELNLWQLTMLQQLGGMELDLIELLRPSIEQLQRDSLDPPPQLVGNMPPAAPGVDANQGMTSPGQQTLDRLSSSLGDQDLKLNKQLDYVPEVATWLLRYYNGVGWQARWDSRVEGRLPDAVEVRFQLLSELRQAEDAEIEGGEELGELLNSDPAQILGGESSTLEPLDPRQQSAQTRPPEDHRYLIVLNSSVSREAATGMLGDGLSPSLPAASSVAPEELQP